MSVVEAPAFQEDDAGLVPPGWKVSRLGDLCSLITKGTTPTTIGFSYQQTGINFIKIESIDGYGNINLRKVAYISDEAHNSLNRSKLHKGDILYSIAGAIGRTAIVQEHHLPANTNQALAIIRPKSSIHTPYLRFALSSETQLSHISQISVSSAQVNISLKDVSSFIVPLPPLSEQKKIAAVLTAVDDKLDIISRQIEAIQSLKQSLMQTLFDRGGDILNSKDWPVVPLSEVAEIRTGIAKGKKGLKDPVELPYLRVANVQDGHIDLREVKTIEIESTQVERYALQSGDVLMTEGGDLAVSRTNCNTGLMNSDRWIV